MNAIALTISDISIRQDVEGRYCLNDLHKAAGNEPKHKPSEWLRNKQAIELIEEVEKAGIPAIQSKQQLGTFALKPLVYAYAMWISAKFHLAVIRAYDALVTSQIPYGLKALPSEPLQKTTKALPGCLTLESQDEIKQLIHDRVALLPKDQQAKAAISLWSALGTHFGIKKEKGDKIPAYKRIPEGARLECLSLLARLSVDDLVTLTQDEYNAIKKALPKPEQLVDPSANTFNLSIGKGSNLTNISIKFNTCDRFYNRWFVTISEGVLMVRPMEMDEISMTFQQWIKHATQEKGYIVVKKSELLDKLTD